ncbi:MAG TPA: type IX secretion system sortase PorU [Fulvivirga sp.]|nr:type IX secretion system sortase PorU [Fulvivirga sp.]
MTRLYGLIIFTVSFCIASQLNAQSSVLAKGSWFKMEIGERGIYKLTYTYLKNAGIDVDNINPQTIKIFGNPGGMLPQSNAVERPFDLQQNAIFIKGEEDGKFDSDDYILFYAQDGDSYSYVDNELIYEHNLYSDVNYYFITFSGDNGIRIAEQADLGTTFPKISTYNDFGYYKVEKYNLLASGREWFSEKYDLTLSQEYSFSFKKLVTNSQSKVHVRVMAQTFNPSSFDINFNGELLGNMPVESVPDFTQKVYRYSIKGKENENTFTKGLSAVNELIDIGVTYKKNSSGQSVGYLNDILVEVERHLELTDNVNIFRSLQSLNNANSTYEIKGLNSNSVVWDITDPTLPTKQQFNLSGSTGSFGAQSSTLREYVVFNTTIEHVPNNISSIPNQNIKGNTDSELLIITNPNFKAQADQLASFRSSNDNIASRVVLIDQVFNEFSSGRQDVSAIRDYVRYLYKNGKIKYLLLFGRGSYDYKNTINGNTNFVPIYESRNSLHPLDTYASDDYFGFLEDEEGEWAEVSGGNHTMDIGVGRLPVRTAQEAEGVVNKLINYSTNEQTIGDWKNNVVFVADDGDFNLHQRQADELTVYVDTTYTAFNPNKFYLDDFPQVSRPNGESAPLASAQLDKTIEKGALIVNFTGHGGESGWMQEQVLDIAQIQSWDNYNKLPLFVTATCEFGRHDDPRRVSGGEMVVTSAKGGGIAIVSTCRPVSSSSNFALNKVFYTAVYSKENGGYLRLGDIFRITKNESNDLATDFNKVGNRNFALLGDPSLRLAYPAQEIIITAINDNTNKSDTLKALGKVKLTGGVKTTQGSLDNSFNGEVSFVIYDKDIPRTTLGNENPPFTYDSRENIIFKGVSTVNAGTFDIEFIVPKNISYQLGNSKINLYAHQATGLRDANGSDIKLKIGGTASSPPTDNEGPEIKLYMGDSLNTNLSGVSHNTFLVATFKDESGINLSGFGLGNNITATLDGEQTFVMNAYYQAHLNSYKKGSLRFPITGLSKGEHAIVVKAWDTYNNSSESRIDFTVADPNSIVIYNLKNYPNPFTNTTNFKFSHNRAGENLKVTLDIISPISGTVFTSDFEIDNSPSEINLFEWNGESVTGDKLDAGIYIFRVTVRSIRDGAKKQDYKKLILIN